MPDNFDGQKSDKGIAKTDIIRYHIIASIQMIAIEANPFSTHLVVMASEELIRSLAIARGIPLSTSHEIFIKDEYHKEYLRILRKQYNWLKHANRDATTAYDGPKLEDLRNINQIQTLMNILSLKELGHSCANIFPIYILFISIKFPQYFNMKALNLHQDYIETYNDICATPEISLPALRRCLATENLLPSLG